MTLFDRTQSQESKSEVRAYEFYAAMRIKTHLDNTLYLSSLWSDLSCAAELVIYLFSFNELVIADSKLVQSKFVLSIEG